MLEWFFYNITQMLSLSFLWSKSSLLLQAKVQSLYSDLWGCLWDALLPPICVSPLPPPLHVHHTGLCYSVNTRGWLWLRAFVFVVPWAWDVLPQVIPSSPISSLLQCPLLNEDFLFKPATPRPLSYLPFPAFFFFKFFSASLIIILLFVWLAPSLCFH